MRTRRAIAQRLLGHNATFLGPMDGLPMVVEARRGKALIGGLWGRSAYRWLFVEMLFIADRYRGRGLGTAILDTAEREARGRDCTGVWLDTFSADAKAFYEARGYTRFGQLDDYPPGFHRWFMRKSLALPDQTEHPT